MPNAARFLVLPAVVLVTAALVWFSRRGADLAPDNSRTDPPTPVTAAPSIPAATGTPTTAGPQPYTPVAAATTAVEGYIAFPDHTWYPPLNGVTKAPAIVFHRLAPFAKVVGKVVTSIADPGLEGYPLLLVQPLTPERASRGAPVIAIDRVGVGPGEEVYCETSREAGLGLPKSLIPADAAIVARVDAIHIPKADPAPQGA